MYSAAAPPRAADDPVADAGPTHAAPTSATVPETIPAQRVRKVTGSMSRRNPARSPTSDGLNEVAATRTSTSPGPGGGPGDPS